MLSYEVVYGESRRYWTAKMLVYLDLIKVSIIRPQFDGKIPVVMTASPYHQGTNDKASDKALYNMNVDLIKKTEKLMFMTQNCTWLNLKGQATLVEQTEETL